MRIDTYTKLVLTAIALLLAVIALRLSTNPVPVMAGVSASDLYIEPGVYMLRSPDGMRQQLGKVVVDLRTGTVWGFPTRTHDPYPVSAVSTAPAVSTPFQMGKLDLKSLDR